MSGHITAPIRGIKKPRPSTQARTRVRFNILLRRYGFMGILSLEKTLWACGPVGLWACGPVGLWACGPVGLWACGLYRAGYKKQR